MNNVLAIVGPTASGKTKLAIEKAKEFNGVIINCDRFQLYNDLKNLTAYPTQKELKQAPHILFGYLRYDQNTTAVDWAKLAAKQILKAWENKQLPIIVGGTGLYLDVLVNGISALPVIPDNIRSKAITLSKNNFKQLCNEVYSFDPKIKDIILPENNHQIIRAWEVQQVSNKSIRYFFNLPKIQFIKANFKYIFLNPDRKILYEKINKRFDFMLKNGAIEEVSNLLLKFKKSSDLISNFQIFKVIGVKEIISWMNGNINYESMVNLSKQHSRNYAKRQITWFKKKVLL